jgi:hypothetical protein
MRAAVHGAGAFPDRRDDDVHESEVQQGGWTNRAPKGAPRNASEAK